MDNFEISVKRFDEFAAEYAERFNDLSAYEKHFEVFCNLMKNKNSKILELGCGPGNVTKYLKQRFPDSKIVALDLAPGMIDIAKKHVTGVDFRLMDVRDISTINSQFDSIMCSFCLPFLSKVDAYSLISDCSKKLLKEGVLYISTMEGDENKAGFETTGFSGTSEIYFNYHKQKDIIDALLKNGFSINYNVKQNYNEPDGSITVDLILIAKK